MSPSSHATPGALGRFQNDFAQALLAPDGSVVAGSTVATLVCQPGFAVYRNTVIKGCVDALQANYPTVARLVGEEWFRAAAARYVRDNLPSGPALLDYGEGFADFLARFEPASAFAYLPGVARLDRFWTEAHAARDEAPIDPSELGVFGVEGAQCVVLRPHASARWAWFDDLPIYTIWQRNRACGPVDGSEIEWRGEGALIVRPRHSVRWISLDAAGCAFVDACAAGRPLAAAGAAALAVDPRADLGALGAKLFAVGAFARAGVPSAGTREATG